ncbi:MAG: HAD family hydrolase [Chloroflexi bacterium]|nr:MAG: HAD family hydrolase [Chloroflexota bacterium]
MLIRAFVFDFDGLILDTEEPIYRSWLEVYQAHGEELPFERWIQTVGSSNAAFDPRGHLEERLGRPLDAEVLEQRIKRRAELILAQAVLPGVVELVTAARAAGLKVGVASSSSRDWVTGHLERLAILHQFDCVRCRDDVPAVKPAPDLYLSVLACLVVPADQAIAIEDSSNGVSAAKAAGMRCVAVPNPITSGLDLSHADLVLPSLTGISPQSLADRLGLNLFS